MLPKTLVNHFVRQLSHLGGKRKHHHCSTMCNCKSRSQTRGFSLTTRSEWMSDRQSSPLQRLVVGPHTELKAVRVSNISEMFTEFHRSRCRQRCPYRCLAGGGWDHRFIFIIKWDSLWYVFSKIHQLIKGSLWGETSVLRTFRKSEKELVKEKGKS